jgi:hypothetical protein
MSDSSTEGELAHQVVECMKRGLTPAQIQELLGLDEVKLRDLIRHRFAPPKLHPSR